MLWLLIRLFHLWIWKKILNQKKLAEDPPNSVGKRKHSEIGLKKSEEPGSELPFSIFFVMDNMNVCDVESCMLYRLIYSCSA